MINIKSKQQRVLKDFQKHVEYILAHELAKAKDMGTARVEYSEKDVKWTTEFAIRLFADLENRIADLNHLKESAEHTEKAVDYVFIPLTVLC
jgi:hypothetical protein